MATSQTTPGTALKIADRFRADRFYTSNDGKRTIGLDGPNPSERDGFESSWSRWAEDVTKLFSGAPRALYRQNTRLFLRDLESQRERAS